MNEVGFRIKSLRQKRNISQKDFSERVCVSQSYLSRVETGKEQPTDMLLKLIALEFTCSLDWLQSNQGEMELNNDIYDYWDRNSAEQLKDRAILDIVDLLSKVKVNNESGISIFVSCIVQILNYLIDFKNSKKSILIMEEFSVFATEFYELISDLEFDSRNLVFTKRLTSASQDIEKALHDLYLSQ